MFQKLTISCVRFTISRRYPNLNANTPPFHLAPSSRSVLALSRKAFPETVHGPGNQPAISHRMGFRNNIAILLRRIGGFNPHKYHVSNSRLYGLFHLHHCVKILNIRGSTGSARITSSRSICLLCQIDGRQGNCGNVSRRSGSTTTSTFLPSWQRMESTCEAPGHHNMGVYACLANLAVYPLDHGLIITFFIFQKALKLLRPELLEKGPQAFPEPPDNSIIFIVPHVPHYVRNHHMQGQSLPPAPSYKSSPGR